jgi:antitoxin VapB
MALHVRDDATDAAVRRVAQLKRKTLTATIREAVERECGEMPFMEAVKKAQDELDAVSQPGGLPADKRFYDELSGEDELTGLP